MHQDKNHDRIFTVLMGSSGQPWALLQPPEHSNIKQSFINSSLKHKGAGKGRTPKVTKLINMFHKP